jgi:hypothetical protein
MVGQSGRGAFRKQATTQQQQQQASTSGSQAVLLMCDQQHVHSIYMHSICRCIVPHTTAG